MAKITHRYILQWTKRITPRVLHLSFIREDEQPIPFVPGQFITINVQGPTKILHRSYSIANAPGKSNQLELAVAYVPGGVASEFLFNLKPGEAIDASGPHGVFVLKDEQPKRYILVATGTGIAPYRSMLDEIDRRIATHNIQVELLMGVRTPDELLFGEDFANYATQNPKFKFSACYSQVESEPEKSFEKKGRILTLFPELNLNPADDIVYLCGNPNMIDDAFTVLTEKGFDKKTIRREKYLFSH